MKPIEAIRDSTFDPEAALLARAYALILSWPEPTPAASDLGKAGDTPQAIKSSHGDAIHSALVTPLVDVDSETRASPDRPTAVRRRHKPCRHKRRTRTKRAMSSKEKLIPSIDEPATSTQSSD